MSRLKPGNRVFVRGWPPVSLEVVDASDRSIVVLRSEHGALVKVGRLAVVLAFDERDRRAKSDDIQR